MNRSRMLQRVLSSFEPETLQFKSRVNSDGGTLLDFDLVNRSIKKIKDEGVYDKLMFLGDNNFAIKKDGSNNIEKLYDASSRQNDLIQLTSSKKPVHTENAIDSFYASVSDGIDDALSVDANFPITTQPFLQIWVGQYVSGESICDYGLEDGIIRRLSGNLNIYSGANLNNGPMPISKSIISTRHDSASSYIRLNGSEVVSGDSGSRLPESIDPICLHAAAGGAKRYSESKCICYILFESDVSLSSIQNIENFLNSEYNVF